MEFYSSVFLAPREFVCLYYFNVVNWSSFMVKWHKYYDIINSQQISKFEKQAVAIHLFLISNFLWFLRLVAILPRDAVLTWNISPRQLSDSPEGNTTKTSI